MKVIANNRILLCALVPLYGADALCAKTPKSSQLDKVYYHDEGLLAGHQRQHGR